HYSVVASPLNVFHLLPLKFEYRLPATSLAFVSILAIGSLLWSLRTKLPEALLWFTIFLLMLIPVLYFKGMSNTFFAERYLYIPSFAMIALVVSTAGRLNIPKFHLIVGAIGVVFALAAVYRNETWRTSERLYQMTLALQPEVT